MNKIPEKVIGLDIECKGLDQSSVILEIGVSVFTTNPLQLIDSIDILIDPNDPDQNDRTILDSTIVWWDAAGTGERGPSIQARAHAWSGKLHLREGLSQLEAFLGKYRYDLNEIPVTMRGPEFDYPLLSHAIEQMGFTRFPFRFRMLDSSRTTDRFNYIMGISFAPEHVLAEMCPNKKYIKHTGICDAIEEGFHTARYYNILQRIQTLPGIEGILAEFKE